MPKVENKELRPVFFGEKILGRCVYLEVKRTLERVSCQLEITWHLTTRGEQPFILMP